MRRFRVVLEQGEDGYIVAHVPALRGCVTQGPTRAEALDRAREAIKGYIETLEAHGEPVPEEDVEFVELLDRA
ncbi:MAG: hypothetical protein GEU80_03510 [Dehalococcoidia bacterium]|nr:hypothetical protein [Dehalococcoidia bacterium]